LKCQIQEVTFKADTQSHVLKIKCQE